MKKLSRGIVKWRVPIFVIALILLIPSALGYLKTRVNYDLLVYLPEEIETMQGQDMLVNEFGTGAFALLMTDGTHVDDVHELEEKISEVEHVEKVIWYDSLLDASVPMEMLPENLRDAFNSGDMTMMAILFDETSSEEGVLEAVKSIRQIAGKDSFLQGVSAVIEDTKELTEKETPIYVAIAVALSALVLSLTMDSYLIPFFFLVGIGFAVIYNLGSNIFVGQISYITKAVAAVIQLGVTMDYSIFLWHRYVEKKSAPGADNKEAMAEAIEETFLSVVGSSVTTIAGFLALCFMTFTLGKDLGLVMAKGVLIGVVCCITVLPSMILIFDSSLEKTRHRPLMPDLSVLSGFVVRHYRIFLIVFAVLLIPAFYGFTHTDVYYKLDKSLPEELDSKLADAKLQEEFNMASMHMVLADSSMSSRDMRAMAEDIEDEDGVRFVLSLDSLVGPTIPESMIPDKVRGMLESDAHKMLIIGSEYQVASDEVNEQCDHLASLVKSYDDSAILVGEAPCMRDLIRITDKDFQVVSWLSIGVIFLIVALVFGSLSLPFILVAAIEFAIFINMGIPCYTGTVLPFVASIIIGTVQLGSTVDYAILMTTRYREERNAGKTKKDAVQAAHAASVQSVFVSAVSFFAATFGVGVYSDIDIISSLCSLMARGALISMAVVVFVLPAFYMVFDRIIIATTRGFNRAAIRQADGR